MKITDKTKRKAEKQRLKRIKAYYRVYDFGDVIYNTKGEKYILVLKKQLNEQFYFIVQDQYGNLLLQKFVYGESVHMVNVALDGRQYAQNSNIFDVWIKEAETILSKYTKGYYKRMKVGTVSDNNGTENCKLVLKKEHQGKYYFVLKFDSCKYRVAKVVYFVEYNTVILSTAEFNRNRRLFASWIDEAKTQS